MDIKALAREKKFGEMETAVYADRSLVGQLVELLAEKDGDVRTGVLNVLCARRDRKSTRLNSSHACLSRMPSSA